MLGQTASWLEDGGKGADLMGGSELRELLQCNVEIGSHSATHQRLSRISPTAMEAEVRESKSALENLLGQEVPFFAYPYGDYNVAVRDAVAQSGYRAALTCSRGSANTAPNAHEIPRKAISYGDSLPGFFWKLAFKNRRKDRYA
jgi:peptidoglycan/xylan/chitin deacetylase (PgdA/CDA1 family)